jgi:hypothetical protein
MKPEAKLILSVIEHTINKNKKEEINKLVNSCKFNWQKFIELISYHELVSFAYLVFKERSFLPPDLFNIFKRAYYYNLIRNQRMWKEFLRILAAFEYNKLSLLPIKGVSFLYDIYSQLPVRPMADIDVLVREEDLAKAEDIFCNLGYKKELHGFKEEYWRNEQCHFAFSNGENKDAFSVELHWSLDFKRKGRAILPEIWERTRVITVDNRKIRLLSPEDALFSIALHNRRFGKPLCLKYVYDTILLLEKYSSTFDWDYVFRMCREYETFSPVYFILYQTKLLFAIKSDCDIWKELKIPFWKRKVIHRFIEKNTFSSLQYLLAIKNLYLKSHFLLYDSLKEPVQYIFRIPKEQFAKFYALQPYDKKTDFFYRNRILYMPLKAIFQKNGSNVPFAV